MNKKTLIQVIFHLNLNLKVWSQFISIFKVCQQNLMIHWEETRTTRTPAFWGYASWLPIPLSHIGSQVKRRQSQSYKFKKFQIFYFWNGHYMRHTFLSCLIRCANMKWIRWVLLKIQSGHDSVHRRTDGQTDGRTDGQTDKVIPVYPPINFVEAGGIINISTHWRPITHDNVTWWHVNIFCIIAPFWGDPSLTHGFPSQMANNAELWCFLCC